MTPAAQWLVTNDSNRRAEIVARDRSRVSLSPLTPLTLPGELVQRFALAHWPALLVESLAHHDVVELMLQTRIPVPRLVDWVDQAILYLHAGPRSADQSSRAQCLKDLRCYGIRTATDLDNAFTGAAERNGLGALRAILNPSPEAAPARLQVMKDALDDEEWMCNIRAWRRAGIAPPKPIRLQVAPKVSANVVPEPAR